MLYAIFVQVGNYKIWKELVPYVEKVYEKGDLYVNLINTIPEVQDKVIEIKSLMPKAEVTISNNWGKDVGQFLYQLELAVKMRKSYDVVLKLHTKSDRNWLKQLIGPICNLEILNKFKDDINMIAANAWLVPFPGYINKRAMISFCNKYGIKIPSDAWFVGGTIFWIRWKPLADFIKRINLVEIYKSLQRKDLSEDHYSQGMYIMERVFGLIGHKILGL